MLASKAWDGGTLRAVPWRSCWLAALEERLGTRLLERNTRRLRLTEVGRQCHAECARLVSEAREVNRALSESRDTPQGTLRIATLSLLGELLTPVIAEFLLRQPRVSGRLRVPSVRAGQAAARAGLGVVRLPASLVTEDVRAGLLVPVLESETPPGIPVFAVYPSRRQLPPKVRAFLSLLSERSAAVPWEGDTVPVASRSARSRG